MTGEGAEVVVDRGEGDEGRGLIRVIFWSAPDNVGNGDGFIRHEGAEAGDQGLVSRTNARRVVGSG
jgi:hypothetical protein